MPVEESREQGWAEGEVEIVPQSAQSIPQEVLVQNGPELREKRPSAITSTSPWIRAVLRQWAWPWVNTQQGLRGGYSW